MSDTKQDVLSEAKKLVSDDAVSAIRVNSTKNKSRLHVGSRNVGRSNAKKWSNYHRYYQQQQQQQLFMLQQYNLISNNLYNSQQQSWYESQLLNYNENIQMPSIYFFKLLNLNTNLMNTILQNQLLINQSNIKSSYYYHNNWSGYRGVRGANNNRKISGSARDCASDNSTALRGSNGAGLLTTPFLCFYIPTLPVLNTFESFNNIMDNR